MDFTRKRIYLFRHGEVNYMPSGKVVADPNLVDLTEKGLLQAKLIDENTKDIYFERILVQAYRELFRQVLTWQKGEVST
jgi:broad specificity phosphatase PhoE